MERGKQQPDGQRSHGSCKYSILVNLNSGANMLTSGKKSAGVLGAAWLTPTSVLKTLIVSSSRLLVEMTADRGAVGDVMLCRSRLLSITTSA